MSSFISWGFLLFLPVVVLINFIVPRKYRYIWLLICSLFFYASIDVRGLGALGITIVITYGFGLLLEKSKGGKNRLLLALSMVICVGLIFLARYLGARNVLAAVGISFYMLKSMGYLIDVSRGEAAEKNIFKLALFVSFFPQLTSGPIDRAKNLLSQFAFPMTVDYDTLRDGLLQILWGYFMKLVVADRLSIYVNRVYLDAEHVVGLTALVATLFYTFEIYCDFAGYTHIAMGCSRLLGIDIMSNFDSPYLSGSVAEFWRRWHISLSSWLKDYVYIPLGGNRKGSIRKYVNILIVFAVSGIWHGTGLTFLIWGLIHGLYQVIGYLLRPARDFMADKLKINRSGFSHRFLKIVVTFTLVNFAWVFFRAGTLSEAVTVIRNSLVFTPWKLADESLYRFGLDRADFMVALLGIAIVAMADIISYFGINLRQKILSQGIWLRYIIGIGGVLVILIFGIWGPGYDSTSFIYQQF